MLPKRLPFLRGARLRVAQWMYLFVLAGVGVVVAGSLAAIGVDIARNWPASARYGFRTATYDDSVLVFAASPAAARAGLHRGDRLLAIDGAALPAGASEYVTGHRLAQHRGVLLLTISRGEAKVMQKVRLAPAEDFWTAPDPYYQSVPLWLSVTLNLLSFSFAMLVPLIASFLISRRRQPDAETILIASGLALQCCGPNFVWWILAVAPGIFPFISNLSGPGWVCILLAIVGFPDGNFTNRFAQIAAVAAPLVVLASKAASTFAMLSTFAPYADILTVGVLGLIIAAVWRRYRAAANSVERQQMKWAIFGTALTILGLAMTLMRSVLVSRTGIAAYPVDLLPMVLSYCGLPLGLVVSQRRYRLYDADAVISRSVALGLLTLGLLAIFAGTEKLIELLGEEYLGESLGAASGALAAAVAAVTIAPLHHRISHWADHRFQGALAHLRSVLPTLLGDLRETSTPGAIAGIMLSRIEHGVGARYSAVITDDRVIAVLDVDTAEASRWLEGWAPSDVSALNIDRFDPLFPMRVRLAADGIGEAGWLLLGPRPDGSLYGRDERQTLEALADPSARALAIALAREKSEAVRIGERKEIFRMLADLHVRMEAIENRGAVVV